MALNACTAWIRVFQTKRRKCPPLRVTPRILSREAPSESILGASPTPSGADTTVGRAALSARAAPSQPLAIALLACLAPREEDANRWTRRSRPGHECIRTSSCKCNSWIRRYLTRWAQSFVVNSRSLRQHGLAAPSSGTVRAPYPVSMIGSAFIWCWQQEEFGAHESFSESDAYFATHPGTRWCLRPSPCTQHSCLITLRRDMRR